MTTTDVARVLAGRGDLRAYTGDYAAWSGSTLIYADDPDAEWRYVRRAVSGALRRMADSHEVEAERERMPYRYAANVRTRRKAEGAWDTTEWQAELTDDFCADILGAARAYEAAIRRRRRWRTRLTTWLRRRVRPA
jgi:hypothetical protein